MIKPEGEPANSGMLQQRRIDTNYIQSFHTVDYNNLANRCKRFSLQGTAEEKIKGQPANHSPGNVCISNPHVCGQAILPLLLSCKLQRVYAL